MVGHSEQVSSVLGTMVSPAVAVIFVLSRRVMARSGRVALCGYPVE